MESLIQSHIAAKAALFCSKIALPGWESDRLSILIFHRALETSDAFVPDCITVAELREKFRHLRKEFCVIPLREAVTRLYAGQLPPRAVSITFDDGYQDNMQTVLPLLKETELHATFFIASGFLNGGVMWNDEVIESMRRANIENLDLREFQLGIISLRSSQLRQQAARRLLSVLKDVRGEIREEIMRTIRRQIRVRYAGPVMMTEEAVRELRRCGMDVGCHTRSHPILSKISLDEARSEILGSRADLESVIGHSVDFFAFPNGVPGRDYGTEHVRIVREAGFRSGFSTASGTGTIDSDRFQLPRFTPWQRSSLGFLLRLAAGRLRTTFPQAPGAEERSGAATAGDDKR